MKKIIFSALLIPVLTGLSALAGDITPGSTPGSLNYQGRLERDNAPITGLIHLTFRIYATPTGGTPVYSAPETVVTAAQGIFSASITPPWSVFSNASGALYLEVQVESDVLSPREPLSSVAYALVAKKLEDGSYVKVSTLTTTGNVGIGTDSPAYKLSVAGSIKLLNPTDAIYFFDGTSMSSSGLGAAVGGVTAPGDSTIESGTLGPGFIGKMTFNTSAVQRMRITDGTQGGRIGIGAAAIANPLGTLDIDGSLYVGSQGIYDRSGGSVTVSGLYIPDGGLTGRNSEAVLIGQTNDVISLVSGGSEKMRVHSNGNVGIGTTAPAATAKLDVAGDILTNTGARAGGVSVGAYTGGALTNEIRTQTAAPLLLQQTNAYNVGIGTSTPVEKLHVRGSIKADMGVIAATAAFSDSVRVDGSGNFYANSGHNMVYLSSTIIYGTLQVTGGVGSDQGLPGYLASTQTFTGLNTFTNPVTFSSDILTVNRLGAGIVDFDFGTASKYLQIGDSAFSTSDAAAYIVGGAAANSKLFFYRGAGEAARFETQTGNNLALVVGNTKSLVDSTYYRVYNSVFWVSTGTNNNTPAVYVSSSEGNVGIGTAVLDPNWKLTVNGNIRLASAGGKIIFSDGTSMATSSASAATSISNNLDAVIQADADANGSGSVLLKAGALDGLMLNSGGNVGIGTLYPSSRLNVRGGDLVLGTPSLGSGGSALEDVFVAGNIVVDGGIIQRSATQVQFSALKVAGDVYLSTGAMTRVGSDTAPAYTLDVAGDMNASGSIRTGGTARISNAGTVGSGNANATWDGNTINVNRGGTGATTLTGVVKGNGTGAFTAMTGTANTMTKWTASDTIGNSALMDDGSQLTASVGFTTTSSGTFKTAVAGGYSVNTSSGIMVQSGVINMNGAGKVVNLLDPTANQEAATKAYVDASAGGGSDIGAWSLNGNNISASRFIGTTGAGDDLVFKTVSVEHMRITAAGTVQIPVVSISGGSITGITDLAVADGGTGNSTGNAATVTNGFYTTSSLAGDVTGTPGLTVVGDNSHAHDGTSISGLAVADFTSSNISNWTNNIGYITSTGTAANFSGSLAGGVTGTQGATVVGNNSHTHNSTTITGGLTNVLNVKDNIGGNCTITVNNGIITASTCP